MMGGGSTQGVRASDSPTLIAQRVLDGKECVISFPGTSQYTQGGSSACGLAAMNCVRVILNLERKGKGGESLMLSMFQKEIMDVRIEYSF